MPLHPLLDRRWITSDVLNLAGAIRFDERNRAAIALILADALMDAGCDNEPFLHYVRTIDHDWRPLVDAMLQLRTEPMPLWVSVIRANPEGYDTQLAFADWRQQEGDKDWAEFVRASCDVERLRRSPTFSSELFHGHLSEDQKTERFEYVMKCSKVDELRNIYLATLAQGLHNLEVTFRCGFVEGLVCTAAEFSNAAIAGHLPKHPLRTVELTDWPIVAVATKNDRNNAEFQVSLRSAEGAAAEFKIGHAEIYTQRDESYAFRLATARYCEAIYAMLNVTLPKVQFTLPSETPRFDWSGLTGARRAHLGGLVGMD